MKIEQINVFQVDLPLKESQYNWSDGKSVKVFDSTVVEVVTDSGLCGYGEVCPLGPYYLPSYAQGVRVGLKELGPKLLGLDPLEIDKVNSVMDYCLKGHPYVKSPIDVACWDILGKHCGLPLCTLLGGRYGEHVVLYRAISKDTPEHMARSVQKYKGEGYTRFQLKLGSSVPEDVARIRSVRQVMDPGDVLVGDANTGWLSHEAIQIAGAVDDIDVYMEQPCVTYEECLRVRQHTNLPFIMDENIDNLQSVLRASHDGICDVINLKISKFGGITKLRQARDLCASLGIAMTIEDTWGGDVITAAISHLAHSTPEKYRFSSTDFNNYGTVSIADGAPRNCNGVMRAPSEPGLGISIKKDILGKPLLTIT